MLSVWRRITCFLITSDSHIIISQVLEAKGTESLSPKIIGQIKEKIATTNHWFFKSQGILRVAEGTFKYDYLERVTGTVDLLKCGIQFDVPLEHVKKLKVDNDGNLIRDRSEFKELPKCHLQHIPVVDTCTTYTGTIKWIGDRKTAFRRDGKAYISCKQLRDGNMWLKTDPYVTRETFPNLRPGDEVKFNIQNPLWGWKGDHENRWEILATNVEIKTLFDIRVVVLGPDVNDSYWQWKKFEGTIV